MSMGIMVEQIPKECMGCNKLKCSYIYMDGTADYACLNPMCKHRDKFKETTRNEQYTNRNNSA